MEPLIKYKAWTEEQRAAMIESSRESESSRDRGERAAAAEEDGGGFRRHIICIGERRFRFRFVSSIVFFVVVDECMR